MGNSQEMPFPSTPLVENSLKLVLGMSPHPLIASTLTRSSVGSIHVHEWIWTWQHSTDRNSFYNVYVSPSTNKTEMITINCGSSFSLEHSLNCRWGLVGRRLDEIWDVIKRATSFIMGKKCVLNSCSGCYRPQKESGLGRHFCHSGCVASAGWGIIQYWGQGVDTCVKVRDLDE